MKRSKKKITNEKKECNVKKNRYGEKVRNESFDKENQSANLSEKSRK